MSATESQLAPLKGSGAMFDAIAHRYDLLNRVMSLGIDQRWRLRTVRALELKPGARVLDLATGTADVALAIARRHPDAHIVGVDPSERMLEVGRRKVTERGQEQTIELHVGDAQSLPFADASFDAVCIAFGIRNVPDRGRALREMARVTRVGGRVAVLELSYLFDCADGMLARLRGGGSNLGMLVDGLGAELLDSYAGEAPVLVHKPDAATIAWDPGGFYRIAKGEKMPPQWAGLKFFNVFGPNEYHKGSMMSVLAKRFDDIREGRVVQLFKSHRDGIADGDQRRDFIHVDDVVRVIMWLLATRSVSGLFNVGTGHARSFRDLILAAYTALKAKPNIEYIDMPEQIRGSYQYFTQAEVDHLHGAGYNGGFTALEDGVGSYVRDFLDRPDRYR